VIKHFLNPPNWFTSASIFCGTYALGLLIAHPERTPDLLIRVCVLVLFGGVFDLLDGRVARMTNRFTEFGVQLDSLADIISFGVAPAMLAWGWKLHELGGVGVVVAFWYVLCAAFRLARFNVASAEKTWTLAGHTQGLTTTMSGGVLVTFVWISNGYLHDRVVVSPYFVAVVVALQGLLMVSSVPFRSFKDVRKNMRARVMLATGLAGCLVGAIALDPSMWFGVGALGYIALGTLDGLVVWLHFRNRPADPPADGPDEDADADDDVDESTAEDSGLMLASDDA
jgi:CDP-diacylglycerol---serine O-phosphatidyltransferase